MGVSVPFPISGERCPHPHPLVPRELWVQMYLQLQVGTRWVVSRAQAKGCIRRLGGPRALRWGHVLLSSLQTVGLSP